MFMRVVEYTPRLAGEEVAPQFPPVIETFQVPIKTAMFECSFSSMREDFCSLPVAIFHENDDVVWSKVFRCSIHRLLKMDTRFFSSVALCTVSRWRLSFLGGKVLFI